MPVVNPTPPNNSGVAAAFAEAVKQEQERRIEVQERLLSSVYEKANAYSQIVLGVGYVSIFAAWSFTKELLTPNEVLWSALLASLSAFVFVMFEVLSMFVTSQTVLGLAKAARSKPGELDQIMVENERNERRLMTVYARAWVWCWGFSVITGVLAGLILISAFVGHLLTT